MDKNKRRLIELAEQQFLGFSLGSRGFSIEELVSSMALKKEEWDYLKKEGLVNSLDSRDIEDVNNYLNSQTQPEVNK